MKKFVLVLVILFVVGALGFKVWTDVRAAQQAAIIAVLTQFRETQEQFRSEFNQRRTLANGHIVAVPPRNPILLRKRYISDLRQISTAKCPETFRLAWLSYIQTLERSDDPLYALAALTEGTVSVVRLSPEGTKDALARLDRLNAPEALRRLEMIALGFGVQFQGR